MNIRMSTEDQNVKWGTLRVIITLIGCTVTVVLSMAGLYYGLSSKFDVFVAIQTEKNNQTEAQFNDIKTDISEINERLVLITK